MNIDLSFDNVLGKKNRFFFMGIAILWVVGYHLYLAEADFYDAHLKLFRNIFKYGYVGVDIFMFFSAYGLCHSYVNSTLRAFYWKRFVRIIPIYLMFEVVKWAMTGHEDVGQWLYYRAMEVSSLMVIQTPLTCPKAISLGWFVPAIINLYIIFPLLFKLVAWIYRKNLAIQVAFVVAVFFGGHFLWGYIHGLYISRVPIIIVGIFTYFYLKDKAYAPLFLLYGLFASLNFFIDRDNLRLSCVVPLILYAVSMVGVTRKGFVSSGLNKVGELSFEVFLAHVYAGNFAPPRQILASWGIMAALTAVFTIGLHWVNKRISNVLLRKI